MGRRTIGPEPLALVFSVVRYPLAGKQVVWLAQQTQNICITFVQRRPNVEDVGPTLYKC